MKRIAPFLVILVLLGLVGWKIKAYDDHQAELNAQVASQKSRPISVDVSSVITKPLSDQIDVTGSFESPFVVNLSPKSVGKISTISVREGDAVKQGQVIVTLDPTEAQGEVLAAQAAVAEAESRLAQAKVTENQTREGVSAGILQNNASTQSSKTDLQVANSAYLEQVASARANVADAQAKLRGAQASADGTKANLGSANATLANAKTKLARTQQLYDKAYVAAQDLDDAKTAVQVAQAAYNVSAQQVRAAESAVVSAQQILKAQQNQESIIEVQGKSTIVAAQAKLDQSQASLSVAKANRSSIEGYHENVLALEAAVQAANGQLTQAQSHLSDTGLASTINGVVTSRNADPGTAVNTGTTILTVQYIDWLYVTIGVSPEQAALLQVGQSATVRANGGTDYTGTISQINGAADLQSREVNVQIKVLNPKKSLKPGMFGEVLITLPVRIAPTYVVREAVTFPDVNDPVNGEVAVVGADNVAHLVPVRITGKDNDGYAVVGQLKPGDQVVSLSFTQIKDGQKVKFNPPKAAGKTGKSNSSPSGGSPSGDSN